MADIKLLEDVRKLSQKAKRRANPFLNRGLFNESLEKLIESTGLIKKGEFTEKNVFGVMQSYSDKMIYQLKNAFNKFLQYSPTYSEYKQLAKNMLQSDESKKPKKVNEIIKEYSTYRESLQHINQAADEIGSPTVHKIMLLAEKKDLKGNVIAEAFAMTYEDPSIYNDQKELIRSKFLKKLSENIGINEIRTL